MSKTSQDFFTGGYNFFYSVVSGQLKKDNAKAQRRKGVGSGGLGERGRTADKLAKGKRQRKGAKAQRC
jgi:hypothetical protein